MSDAVPSAISFWNGAFENDVAAVFACARSEIDDVIRGAHHVRIVLDHEDRIAEIAQLFENLDQPAGVAAVQSDRRLVEHIAGADQPRTEASRELNTLRFASRKRRRQPVQRQISRPTSFRNFSRCRISTRILSAIAISSGDKLQRKEECLGLKQHELNQ